MSETQVKRIVELLIRSSTGNLSFEEERELQAWIAENREFYESMTGEKLFDDLNEQFEAKQRVAATLRAKLTELSLNTTRDIHASKARLRRIKSVTWWAASVLLIGAVITIFAVVNNKYKATQPIVARAQIQADILPGGNKAVLTLAGGSSIVLDSATSGIVANEIGVTVQKTADGSLEYTVSRQLGNTETHPEAALNTLTTPRGGQYTIQLSDGSKVWLNAASSLQYPVSFTGNERRVILSGEAYFEIAKVHRKEGALPFFVEIRTASQGTSKGIVEVLGTHFNINAYPDEDAAKTTLLEGSVKVSLPATGNTPSVPQHPVLLKPGQQAQIASTNNSNSVDSRINVVSADTDEVISWKNGITSFDNATIKSLMRKVSRWYDIDVVYEGNIPDRLFMGGISRNSNLSELIRILERSKIHFSQEGRKIIVRP